MSEDTTTLRGLLADFRDTLETDKDNILESSYPEDVLHEYADSAVPIYTADLMELAANNIDLATDEPECGPAFDGAPTPVNIVAANVYEALIAEGYDWLREVQDESEEEDQD